MENRYQQVGHTGHLVGGHLTRLGGHPQYLSHSGGHPPQCLAEKHIDPPQFGFPSSPLRVFTSGLVQDPVPVSGAKSGWWIYPLLDRGVNNGCVCGGNWEVVEVAATPHTLARSIHLKPQVA